jgi:ActR/RegA family two-component response regulator
MKITDTREQCAALLKKVTPGLNADDRRAAMSQFNLSYATIRRYLSGEVANLARGIQLLNFFRQRLQKRVKAMKKEIKRWDEVMIEKKQLNKKPVRLKQG